MEISSSYTQIVKAINENPEILELKNELEEFNKLFNAILDISSNLIIILNDNAQIVKINKKACELFNYQKSELIGENFFYKIYPYHLAQEYNNDFKGYTSQRDRHKRNLKTEIINNKGEEKYIKFQTLMIQEDDLIKGQLLVGEDLTENYLAKETIEFMAYHDGLTKLPNRAFLFKEIDNILNKSKIQNWAVVMMFLDFDNFKACNDNYGHDAGDEMLLEITKRLKNTLRTRDKKELTRFNQKNLRESEENNSDLIIRLGGDEFLVVLTSQDSKVEEARKNSEIVAKRLRDIFRKPFDLLNNTVVHQSGVSIGITIFPFDASNIDELLKQSDKAMYHAKKSGKDNYIFSSDLKL